MCNVEICFASAVMCFDAINFSLTLADAPSIVKSLTLGVSNIVYLRESIAHQTKLSKIKEQVKEKIETQQDTAKEPVKVFISYCQLLRWLTSSAIFLNVLTGN